MERMTVVGVVGNIEGVFDFLFYSITSLSLNWVSVNICMLYNTPARKQALSFTTSLSFSNWNYVQRKKILCTAFFLTVLISKGKIRRGKRKGENRATHLRHICIYGFNYVKLPKHFLAKPSSAWCLHTNRLFLSFSPLYQAPFQAFSGPGRHIVNRNWSLHSSTWNLFLSPLPDGCCLALLVSDLRNACSDLLNQKCSSLWIKNSLLEILFHTHALFS